MTDPQAASRSGAASVVAAVRNASQRTGADFSYLLEKASVESSFKTDAKSATSSATGLFQFIDRTWLEMIQQHGAKYGLGDMAQAIQRNPNGGLTVPDAAMRQKILNLRNDPVVASLMAGELAQDNKEQMQEDLGRPVGKTDLYMAHFLGAGSATKFLKALQQNPNQPAANLFPEAARANRSVFYSDTGKAKSLGEIYDRFANRFGGEATQFAGATSLGTVRPLDQTSQPWLSGARSGSSGKEPLSTFTVMILNQMLTPLDTPSNQQRKDEESAKAPGLGLGVMAAG